MPGSVMNVVAADLTEVSFIVLGILGGRCTIERFSALVPFLVVSDALGV